MASKVVEAVHPDFDWGETYGEYCYWESATIILTARNISASRAEIICNGLDHDYLFYMPIGFADYEVNNPWSKQLKVDYITHIAEVRLWV